MRNAGKFSIGPAWNCFEIVWFSFLIILFCKLKQPHAASPLGGRRIFRCFAGESGQHLFRGIRNERLQLQNIALAKLRDALSKKEGLPEVSSAQLKKNK